MKGKRIPRVYIVGAGFAGVSLAIELKKKEVLGDVVAFLDDDPSKIGRRIEGVPVLGPIDAVIPLLDKHASDEALIALPSAEHERLVEVYRLLEEADFARIRILPTVSQVIDGGAHFIQTREIDPQDLLGRTPVPIDLRKSLSYLRGKRVLITGAGGSIGSELCRQLLSGGADRLYLFGHGENSIYEIDRELRLLQEEGVGEKATIVPVIGEIQDADYMRYILRRLRADVVLHTAAYKHVPMMEANPVAAVANNVFGTENLVNAAKEAGVERFVFISTDKVVSPAGVYGASKRIAEEIVLQASLPESGGAGDTSTNGTYMVVRFGNVLSSRGSIVPLFQKQIARGGPVTVTHPEVSRYYMTIPEASSLVLQTGGVGTAGSLYVLDMGEPLLIREMAEQLITFSGFTPYEDIDISFVGLRPGEKLCEQLVADGERVSNGAYDRISRIEREHWPAKQLSELLSRLRPVCYFDESRPDEYRARRRLREIIGEYIPSIPVPDDEPQY